MKKSLLSILLLGSLYTQAQNFKPNNIVVSRVGNGNITLGNNKTAPITLLEFNRTGQLQTSLLLDSLGTTRITAYGGTNAAGQVTRSADGRYLLVAGFDTTTQTAAAVAQGTKRVVARVDFARNVDYSKRFVAASGTTNNVAVSDSGTRVWSIGKAGNLGFDSLAIQTQGPYYVNGVGPSRTLSIDKKQLYNLRAFDDLAMYRSTNNTTVDPNTGMPTSTNTGTVSSSTTQIAVGLSSSASMDGFAFYDLDPAIDWNGTGYDVVYFSNVNQGIEKYFWSTTDSTWKPANSQFQVPVTITDGGSGYSATTLPVVTISAPPTGTTATARAVVAGGKVTHLVVRAGINLYPTIPTITIAAPAGGGTQATATFDALLPTNGGFFGFKAPYAQLVGSLTLDGKPLMYAVSGNGTASNNTLVAITDNGYISDAMDATNVTVDSITVAGINNGFRGVALSPQEFTLPINLASFTGSLINDKSNLKWITANEVNAKEFAIERSSDGANFLKIGVVSAKNRSYATSYIYEDASPTKGANYYRLKMIDNDGSFTYSNVVVISLTAFSTSTLQIFPNPVISTITISHPKADIGTVVKVLSIDGKMIMQYNIAKNVTQTSFDVSKLKAGQYIISYKNNDASISKTFVK